MRRMQLGKQRKLRMQVKCSISGRNEKNDDSLAANKALNFFMTNEIGLQDRHALYIPVTGCFCPLHAIEMATGLHVETSITYH